MKVDKRKMRWGRPVHMLASLQGRSLLRLLRSDELLQKWEGKSFPRCGDGFLGDLYFNKVKQVWAHRCKKRGCQFRLQPHDYHPIFFAGSGVSQTSLSLQAAILCCALSGVPVSSVPALLDIHPKPVERIYTNLEVARSRYVQLTGKKIVFGANKKWSDVEADEVDLGKEELIKAGEGIRSSGSSGEALLKEVLLTLWFFTASLEAETDLKAGTRPWPNYSQRLGTYRSQTLI